MVKANKEAISKQKKTSLFVLLNALVFIILLAVVVLKFFVFTEEKIPDNHGVISMPPEFFDISEILSQPYAEVTSVSTKYSLLYKDGNDRKMYVFAVPVRETENDWYYLFDNNIYENGDGTFETRNKEFNVAFGKSSINLAYFIVAAIFKIKMNDFKQNIDIEEASQKKD